MRSDTGDTSYDSTLRRRSLANTLCSSIVDDSIEESDEVLCYSFGIVNVEGVSLNCDPALPLI